MTSMADWKSVWSRRQAAGAGSPLQALIDLDGFDSGAGRIREAAWRAYVTEIAGRLGMHAGDSVLEIGCGSGAFLFPLREAGLRVAGLDYSPTLVAAARAAMPDGDFREAEAGEFAAAPRSVDFVVANSVFHYFPDDAYADRVLAAMLGTADRAVAVLELPELDCRDDAEAARRGLLSDREYEAKYAGLAHRYFRRESFSSAARRHGFDAEMFGQSIDGYAQNAFRFNCLLRRISPA